MTNEEIIVVMKLGKSAGLVSKYKRIWKIATGTDWTSCLCGNGFTRLYTTCKNYATKLENDEKRG